MTSMMNDECQVINSIDMCLCSLVFVRVFVLVGSRSTDTEAMQAEGIFRCIAGSIRRTKKDKNIDVERGNKKTDIKIFS